MAKHAALKQAWQIRDVDLYRSRPVNRIAAQRFPHTLYYAVHFDEDVHKFAFVFLGPDAQRETPDVLTGIDAYNQWSRFVDVMTSDPLTSGVRVERLGHYGRLEGCVAAAREDAQRQRAPT